MPRQPALLLSILALAFLASSASTSSAESTTFVGPTQILLADQDTVLTVVTREWLSAATRHQEKLLRHGVRMKYWAEHLPPDMRMVFDALGYPLNRVQHLPVGHTEEWWYYGILDPPLRFRDGELLDTDRFEDLISR